MLKCRYSTYKHNIAKIENLSKNHNVMICMLYDVCDDINTAIFPQNLNRIYFCQMFDQEIKKNNTNYIYRRPCLSIFNPTYPFILFPFQELHVVEIPHVIIL
jgi:hypothetical protein